MIRIVEPNQRFMNQKGNAEFDMCMHMTMICAVYRSGYMGIRICICFMKYSI